MKLEELVIIPVKTKKQLESSLSICGKAEINVLKKKYKVIVVGKYEDWLEDDVEYYDCGLEFPDFWGTAWNVKWEKVAKLIRNDRLFHFHTPFPVLNFYNKTMVKGFVFPKISVRYHSDVYEFMPGGQREVFLMVAKLYPSIFGSKFTVDRIRKTARESGLMFHPEHIWYSLHPTYIDFERIDKAEPILNEKFVIQYASQHFFDKKALEDSLWVTDNLYKMGYDFQFRFNTDATLLGEETIKEWLGVKDRPYIDLVLHPIREQYYSEIKGRHAFFSLFKEGKKWIHTGGITFLEMLYADMIGIFYKAGYVKEKVGIDYPYAVDSKEEALISLKSIIENYDNSKKIIEPYRKKIYDAFNKESWSNSLYGIFEHVEKRLFKE